MHLRLATVLGASLLLAGCTLCWPRGGSPGVCEEEPVPVDDDDDVVDDDDMADDDDVIDDDDDAVDDDDTTEPPDDDDTQPDDDDSASNDDDDDVSDDDDDSSDSDPDDDDDSSAPPPCTLDWSTPLLTAEGYDVVCVEPGSFTMGSPTDEADRDLDEVEHPVELTNWIVVTTTEVGQALYELVSTRPQDDCSLGCDPDLPAHGISWLVAVGFCNSLSSQEGLQAAYSITPGSVTWDPTADGYRLLTEAEWEYIARPGTGAGPYSGSATLSSVGWCDDTVVHELGTLADNGWGVFDMSGNVSEWVWDRYDAYPDPALLSVDPTGPTTGATRVAGGGYYDDGAPGCGVADRDSGDPEIGVAGRGFRLARTVATGP